MGPKAGKLEKRIRQFIDELTAFIEGCSERDWQKRCAWEEWTVGVTARHIAAGHLEALGLVKMIVDGRKLPEFTGEQLTQMANDHARQNAACTRQEVAGILRRNGAALADYVAGLSDEELGRTGRMALVGGEITAENMVKAVILKSGGEHFANIKAAIGK